MSESPRGSRRWADEELAAVAAQYTTPSAFHKANAAAYMAAKRRGIYDTITAHFETRFWTPEKIKEEAAKYQTRAEFAQGSYGAYSAAARHKIIDEVCAHMPRYAGKGKTRGPNVRTTQRKSRMANLMGL